MKRVLKQDLQMSMIVFGYLLSQGLSLSKIKPFVEKLFHRFSDYSKRSYTAQGYRFFLSEWGGLFMSYNLVQGRSDYEKFCFRFYGVLDIAFPKQEEL